jgi:hypothetical protein
LVQLRHPKNITPREMRGVLVVYPWEGDAEMADDS